MAATEFEINLAHEEDRIHSIIKPASRLIKPLREFINQLEPNLTPEKFNELQQEATEKVCDEAIVQEYRMRRLGYNPVQLACDINYHITTIGLKTYGWDFVIKALNFKN